MSELWTWDGKRLTLRPHTGQARALRSQARFVLMMAGTQGGKTSLEPLWLHREMQRCGVGDYLAVTPTVPLLRMKMLPEFLRLFVHTLHLGEWKASDKAIICHDGSRIIFGSAVHPESLESATAKAAVLDEAGQDQFRLESWEAIQRRLALNQGRAFIGTTPYNLGWLKQQIFDRWQKGDRDYDVIQFESVVNPSFPRAEYERAKATLPGWKFDMFYRGLLSRPAGMIYEDYRDDYRERGGHLVRPFHLPPEWPRHVGVDFGAVNTALIWVAHDPGANVYYLYDESLEGGKTTGQHAAAALAKAERMNVRTWYGGAKSETQQRMDWDAEGVPVQEPLIADVEAGIDRVTSLLKTFRLYVFDHLVGLRDELGTYSREVDELGQATEKIKDKEKFHRLDALRYCTQALVEDGRPLLLWGDE